MDAQQQQAECAVCGNAAFDLLDGLYFCSECGTQSQDVREELTENTAEPGESVGFRRLIKSSSKKKEKDGEDKSSSVKEEGTGLSQLEIFQLILQKQCEAIINLGVDPSIKEAVKLLWFHYLRYYGYAFTDSQTCASTPCCHSHLPSPCTPDINWKKGRGSTPLEGHSSSAKLNSSSVKTEVDETVPGDGETPKKRGRGRPRKEYSQLLSKSGRRKRRAESTQSGTELTKDGSSSRRDVRSGMGSVSDIGGSVRKRYREGGGASSSYRAKRIKTEDVDPVKDEERDIFDSFPSDDHLFTSSQDSAPKDANAAGSIKEEGGGETSGSDSDQELTGMDLFLQRRRETQLVTGQPMYSYFSLKYTICLCYLGLLYIEQNVLLSDLVRWTLLNKVPYNNFASIFPRSVTSSTNFQAYMALVPLTADRVYYLARALHSHLKLPSLPSQDPGLVCHTIIDRLQLSPCFHTLLDKALLCMYRPVFEECFRHIDRRFDGECMALVLLLVRLVYKLDDECEFDQPLLATPTAASQSPPSSSSSSSSLFTGEQPSTSTSASTTNTGNVADDSPSCELALYPWEDWVVLYLRHMRQMLNEKEIPTNERELEYVTNYQTYVDFCRVEIFQATRPTPLSWVRRSIYNPQYYVKLSEIFRRYHSKVEQNVKVTVKSEDGSSGSDNAPGISGTNEGEQLPPFVPRQTSLYQLLNDPQAPWRNYIPLRNPQRYQGLKHSHLMGVDLSHSMSFLINAGAQLLDIRPEELYEQLLRVETSFVTVLKGLKKLEQFMTASVCRQ